MNSPTISYPCIEVQTFPQYEPRQSRSRDSKYFYSYRITIRHLKGERCQLISRRWLITDANGQKQEVVGDGVIGQQPTLDSGEEFTYTSGCLLETPVGTMEGHYIMRTLGGTEFTTPIEPFLLAVPGSIN